MRLGSGDCTGTAIPYQQSNLTAASLAGGIKPYTHLSRQFLGNLNLDWTSADERFGYTAYVRNVGDNVYPTGVSLQTLTAARIDCAPPTYGVRPVLLP